MLNKVLKTCCDDFFPVVSASLNKVITFCGNNIEIILDYINFYILFSKKVNTYPSI